MYNPHTEGRTRVLMVNGGALDDATTWFARESKKKKKDADDLALPRPFLPATQDPPWISKGATNQSSHRGPLGHHAARLFYGQALHRQTGSRHVACTASSLLPPINDHGTRDHHRSAVERGADHTARRRRPGILRRLFLCPEWSSRGTECKAAQLAPPEAE